MDDIAVRRLIRTKLLTGQLPKEIPDRIWGGPGTSMKCDACEQPITPEQQELEVLCHDEVVRRYHVRCQQLVAGERDLL